MRMSKLFGRRFKEIPREVEVTSHIFLLRGGYIRLVSSGIYSLLPLGYRITHKIRRIIQEEMDRIACQELLMPLVQPGELWQESGRYNSIGLELLRFQDRNDKHMVLGMTNEEVMVDLVRHDLDSYKQLPISLYHIQRKYRDEARPRAGLIRIREFTMKDAYSFHADFDSLEKTYQDFYTAYEHIFSRIGLNDVIAIQSDTGMMGGSKAHEFIALADCGEDIVFLSPGGEYKANRDIAKTASIARKEDEKPLEKIHTPSVKTVQELCAFLGVDSSRLGKAVFYYEPHEETLVFVLIRGDLEVNELKLKKVLSVDTLDYASDEQIQRIDAVPGYASPLGINLHDRVQIVCDRSFVESANLIVGANHSDHHYRNFNFLRDMQAIRDQVQIDDIAMARAGDPCPVTGESLIMKRGIEVGNIFQLGSKYCAAMNCQFLDRHGKRQPMIMGCYGIGVERAMASVLEQNHDRYGPIWPLSISPYHVHLCALNRSQSSVSETAERLYRELIDAGIEVLYDDRGEKVGVSFYDADLIGIPFRLIVSPKTIEKDELEFRTRDGRRVEYIAIKDSIAFIHRLLEHAE